MSCIQLYQITSSSDSALDSNLSKLSDSFKGVSGLRSFRYAKEADDPKTLSFVANFESSQAHEEWTSSPAHKTSTDLLAALSSDGPLRSDVVLVSADAEPALGADTAELVSWIYPVSKVDEAFEQSAVRGFGKFCDSVSASKWASGGSIAGWSVNTFRCEGQEARRFTGFIGWKSPEAHYECKKTPTFTDHIHWMELGHIDIEMAHYDYKKA